jgi:UDP-glucose 4-epimerase
LAQALIEIFNPVGEIRIIGTRHGEKLYESLISREEIAHALNEDRYYRIPSDNRDLNYAKYYSDGEEVISQAHDYTSHNTELLNIEQVKALLLKLDYIQEQLHA